MGTIKSQIVIYANSSKTRHTLRRFIAKTVFDLFEMNVKLVIREKAIKKKNKRRLTADDNNKKSFVRHWAEHKWRRWECEWKVDVPSTIRSISSCLCSRTTGKLCSFLGRPIYTSSCKFPDKNSHESLRKHHLRKTANDGRKHSA